MAKVIKLTKLKGQAKVDQADALINAANGQFFAATFTKKDGSIRTGQFRTGVAKHVSGAGQKYDPKDYGLRGVWESGNKEGHTGPDAYRNINLETLTLLKIGGLEYQFK